MAYNDNTVAINPDGNGNSVFYSDENPTINGQTIGGGYSFGADGDRNGHATAQIIWGRHHVASANGYYIMNDDRMLNTSETFTTLNVIDGSGSISNHITTTGTILRGKTTDGTPINFITKTSSGGGLRFGADDSVILGAGEMGATIQNNVNVLDEAVHIGGESGVYFYSSPDNISSGWAGRYSMRFNESGRLGIGTESPTLSQTGQGLHICSGNPGIRLDAGATGWGYLEFYRGATAKYIQGYRDVNGFYRIAPGSSLSTCAGITINPDGYVGVGVCETPKQQLEVHGNILLGANDVSSVLHGGGNIAMSADANLLFVADSNTTSDSPDSDIIFGGGSSVNTDTNRGFGFNDAYPSIVPRCEWMRIRYTGNIGIGINSPTKKLHVNGDFAIGTGTPINNIGLMEVTEDGSAKGIGFYAGSGTSFRVYRAGDIGILGRGDNINLSINCFGNVGINSCIPGSYKLYVNGAFYAAGSSCEYKTQICQYNTDSCMFMKLTPVTYQYKDAYTHLGKELKSGTQIGLIAEDVAEVYPELAILKDEDNEKIVRNVDYEKLSIVLLSEVQKLRKELDELKTK